MLQLVVSNDRPLRYPLPVQAKKLPPCIKIVPAELPHLRAMEADMRDADRLEVTGLGVSVRKALWRAYRNSPVCKTAFVDGTVAAMWGVCVGMRGGVSLLGATGIPWLHTTAAVEKVPVSFARIGKAELAAMLALYPRLENFVAAEYVGAIRFLTLLGFTIDEAKAVGVDGARYHRFHLGCE
jgi:hypothetical protein